MRIIHVGGLASPYIVDGINTVIWTIAREQVRLGHQVGLLVSDKPDTASKRHARDHGIELLYVPATRWRFDATVGSKLIVEPAADIVHFHSVFIPRQATLARDLRRWGIPYVVTPHGGLMPQVLARGRLKKRAYSLAVERPRIERAAGIAYVTPGGEDDIRRFVPRFNGPCTWVANPVDVDELAAVGWQPSAGRPQITFLGRYDVFHKGLDRLAEIAARTPEADFQLFGIEDRKTRQQFERIRRAAPANLVINEPVFEAAKLEVLSRSTMYIQVSRWEALSISILEALALGTPAAIAEGMSMAAMFRDNDLGLVLSIDPAQASAQLSAALVDPARLNRWSTTARAYARANFAPQAVAEKVLDVYRESLAYDASVRGRALGRGITLERERRPADAPARFVDERQQEERATENLHDLLDRRHRRVEKAVQPLTVGDDA